eukprot:g27838.t1
MRSQHCSLLLENDLALCCYQASWGQGCLLLMHRHHRRLRLLCEGVMFLMLFVVKLLEMRELSVAGSDSVLSALLED